MTAAEKKQALSELIKALSQRADLSYPELAEKMSQYMGRFISDKEVESHFIRPDRYIGHAYLLEEVLALVRVLATFPAENKRCRAGEAFQIFNLCGIRLEEYPQLKRYFPEEEYLSAWKEFQQKLEAAEELIPPFSLPPYPRLFIGREADLVYLEGRFGLQVASLRQPLTIVRGWPGVGKTTLVQHLVNNIRIQKAFTDGVLWGSLGDKGGIHEVFKRWARELGLYHLQQIEDIAALADGLRQALWGKKILVVVDDIWKYGDGQQLLQLMTPQSSFLLTTRFTDLATRWTEMPEEDVYKLPVLTEEKSIELLLKLAPQAVKAYPHEMKSLVITLEGLPLALRVAGGLLQRESAINLPGIPRLIKALEENFAAYADTAVEQRMNEETGITPTIQFLFERSLATLNEDEQEAFAALGIFAPKPATFNLAALVDIWETADPWPYVRSLVGRGLLEPLENKERRFQMHYTLAMYAKSLLQ